VYEFPNLAKIYSWIPIFSNEKLIATIANSLPNPPVRKKKPQHLGVSESYLGRTLLNCGGMIAALFTTSDGLFPHSRFALGGAAVHWR
jgi:hypothetical protein